MQLRPLPAEEAAVRRYVEQLWVPYHRELEATVEDHALADDVDLVAEEVEFRLDRLESDDHRAWVAVDGDDAFDPEGNDAPDSEGDDALDSEGDDALDSEGNDTLDSERADAPDAKGDDALDAGEGEADPATTDADLVGFVTTTVDEPPSVFDRPDRLIVGDVYVREPYRGTGLARRLIDRAAERARDEGCTELALDVDVDNERALAFYEKLGFETYRRRLAVDVEEL